MAKNPNVEIRLFNKAAAAMYDMSELFKSAGAAAIDLCACIDEPILVRPGEQVSLNAGIGIFIGDPAYCAMILPRSGWGTRGLVLANTVGLIDSDYQGELTLELVNRQLETRKSGMGSIQGMTLSVNPGDRIAQLVVVPVVRPSFALVDAFTVKTARGTGGFGSTGA